VLKHSGEIHQSTFRWTYPKMEKEPTWTIDILAELKDKLIEEEVSSKFIKSIHEEFNKLLDEDGKLPFDHDPLLQFELKRLFLRAKNSDYDKEEAKTLVDKIYSIYNFDNEMTANNFFHLLEIMDFLHRHVNPIQLTTNPTPV